MSLLQHYYSTLRVLPDPSLVPLLLLPMLLFLMVQLQRETLDICFETIPRGREVRQSYITSAFTTLYSLLVAARVVLRHKPQLVSSAHAAMAAEAFDSVLMVKQAMCPCTHSSTPAWQQASRA
jgi:uncharacterized membrane protein